MTGTDTGVGKTLATCALAASLVRRGRASDAMKPIETGVDARRSRRAMEHDWPARLPTINHCRSWRRSPFRTRARPWLPRAAPASASISNRWTPVCATRRADTTRCSWKARAACSCRSPIASRSTAVRALGAGPHGRCREPAGRDQPCAAHPRGCAHRRPPRARRRAQSA